MDFVDYLSQFVSPERLAKINTVVQNRTRYLTLVLEDIFDRHNMSACIRTCEATGIQDLHVIENYNFFEINQGIAIGAEQWINIHRYNRVKSNNTEIALRHLKERGYRLLALSPHSDFSLENETDLTQPIALVLGSEKNGISETTWKLVDQTVRIPMYGFTESFNISVCAALCAYTLMEKIRTSNLDWRLPPEEQKAVKLEWLRRNVRGARKIEKRFIQEISGH